MIVPGTRITMTLYVQDERAFTGDLEVKGAGYTRSSMAGRMSWAVAHLAGTDLVQFLAGTVEAGLNARSPLTALQAAIRDSEDWPTIPLF